MARSWKSSIAFVTAVLAPTFVAVEARAGGRTAPTCYPIRVTPSVFRDVPANIPRFVYPAGIESTKTSVTFVELAADGPKPVALTYAEAAGRTHLSPATPLTDGANYRVEWDPKCNELVGPPFMEFHASAAAPFPTAFGSDVEIRERGEGDGLAGRRWDVDVPLDASFVPGVHVYGFEILWDGGPATYAAAFTAGYVEDGGRHLLRGDLSASCPTQAGEPASTTTHTLTIRASSPSFDGVLEAPPAPVTLHCPSRENEVPRGGSTAGAPPATSDDDGGCSVNGRRSGHPKPAWLLVAFASLSLLARRRFGR